MDQKIITSNSAENLNHMIKEAIAEGYVPIGSHKVITVRIQNRFSGSLHTSSEFSNEYSQTIQLKS